MRILTAVLLLGAGIGAGTARAQQSQTGDAKPDPPVAAAHDADAAPHVEAPSTFETLAQGATAVGDVATLLGSLVDKCGSEPRALDRARCRAAQAYLRRTLPERTFAIAVDDPAAVSVSAYDPAIKGYRIALAACVTCTSPVAIGRDAQPALITLKKPAEPKKKDDKGHKGATEGETDGSLAASVEIATAPLSFASEAEAVRWLREVRPRLRAAMIFKPAANEWHLRAAHGYAMDLVAGRVVDPCTGAIVLSSPPSSGVAERAATAGCKPFDGVATTSGSGGGGDATGDGDGDEDRPLPIELSRNVIAEAMGRIRSQIFACFQREQVPGVAQLTYEVAGNGQIQAVRIEGTFKGTPTGACVLEAARSARFSRFDGPIQTFSYPFFLRR